MGDKSKIMKPRAPRLGSKWETSGDDLKSYGPEHLEWEASGRQVENKSIKIMWHG